MTYDHKAVVARRAAAGLPPHMYTSDEMDALNKQKEDCLINEMVKNKLFARGYFEANKGATELRKRLSDELAKIAADEYRAQKNPFGDQEKKKEVKHVSVLKDEDGNDKPRQFSSSFADAVKNRGVRHAKAPVKQGLNKERPAKIKITKQSDGKLSGTSASSAVTAQLEASSASPVEVIKPKGRGRALFDSLDVDDEPLISMR